MRCLDRNLKVKANHAKALIQTKKRLLRREVAGTVGAFLTALGLYALLAPIVLSSGSNLVLGLLLDGFERANTTYHVSKSPAKLGEVTFKTVQDYDIITVTLQLNDYSAPNGQPIDWGEISDSSQQYPRREKAYWSKDGTVFVLPDRDLMYDFKRHLTEPPAAFIDRFKYAPYPSYDVKKFIKSRGGVGRDAWE